MKNIKKLFIIGVTIAISVVMFTFMSSAKTMSFQRINKIYYTQDIGISGKLVGNSPTIKEGKEEWYCASFKALKGVKWKISNNKLAKIVEIDKSGSVNVKALRPGTVKLTATYKKKKYTYKIKVVEGKKPALNKKSAKITVGDSTNLTINYTNKKIKWSASNKNVTLKKVDKWTVKVVGKKQGTTTITGKIGKKKYKVKVTVEKPQLNKSPMNLTVGFDDKLSLNFTNYTGKIEWTSSNKDITLKKSGKYAVEVLANKPCTATVTAKFGKTTLKTTIVAKELYIPKTMTAPVREFTEVDVKNIPKYEDINWTISNSNIKFNEGGYVGAVRAQIQGRKLGTSVITVTIGKKSYKIQVTVGYQSLQQGIYDNKTGALYSTIYCVNDSNAIDFKKVPYALGPYSSGKRTEMWKITPKKTGKFIIHYGGQDDVLYVNPDGTCFWKWDLDEIYDKNIVKLYLSLYGKEWKICLCKELAEEYGYKIDKNGYLIE